MHFSRFSFFSRNPWFSEKSHFLLSSFTLRHVFVCWYCQSSKITIFAQTPFCPKNAFFLQKLHFQPKHTFSLKKIHFFCSFLLSYTAHFFWRIWNQFQRYSNLVKTRNRSYTIAARIVPHHRKSYSIYRSRNLHHLNPLQAAIFAASTNETKNNNIAFG